MATHRTRSRKCRALAGTALALCGFAGSLGSLDQLARRSCDFFCLSLRVLMDTLPAISLGAWPIWQVCITGHLRVLEGLLEVSGSCWQIVLTLAGVA